MGKAFLTRVLCAALVVAVALTPVPAPAAELLIANSALRIGVDDASGVITRVTHVTSGIELLTTPASVPFVLDSVLQTSSLYEYAFYTFFLRLQMEEQW